MPGKVRPTRRDTWGGTTFWLDEKGTANVISLKMLEQTFHITYNSKKQGVAFVCHTPKGAVLFERCPATKFPYINLDRDKSGAAAMLVQTIRQNFKGYTCEEVERAILARKMQSRSGHPSEAAFKREVSRSSHVHCSMAHQSLIRML
jgi:hypothetical protein